MSVHSAHFRTPHKALFGWKMHNTTIDNNIDDDVNNDNNNDNNDNDSDNDDDNGDNITMLMWGSCIRTIQQYIVRAHSCIPHRACL